MYELPDYLKAEIYEELDDMSEYTKYYTWEEPLYSDEMTRDEAVITIALVSAILGIAVPMIPLSIGVLTLIKKRGKIDVSTYIIICASAIWVISGIIWLLLSIT